MKQNRRIVFMGTPGFAVPTLRAILNEGLEVAAVITAPDKPAGRGRKITLSEVKKEALESSIPLLQPLNLKSPEFIQQLQALQPDLQVVVAFRMLPREVWQLPRLGTINLHASLLPQYRGAAPINHAIMNGEKETGLTTFFIDEKIDTGRIIYQEKMAIGKEETAGELHDRMMHRGARLVIRTIDSIFSGEYSETNQEQLTTTDQELKKAPRISKEDCFIQWDRPAEQIFNFVRGLSPVPGASTTGRCGDKTILLKIFRARYRQEPHREKPGTILTDRKKVLKVAAADGFLYLLDLQQAGKKRMIVTEFLKGNRDIGSCQLGGSAANSFSASAD